MIVGEDFKPGDIVQIVTDNERVFSILIPETANPTFRDFLDHCAPTPYNSSPDEVAELLMEFAELMDEMLNTPLRVETCLNPECCQYPDCLCDEGLPLPGSFIDKALAESIADTVDSMESAIENDPCCIGYEDDLYNGENTTLNNAQNVTIYANEVYMDGE